MALLQAESVSKRYQMGETTVNALTDVAMTVDSGEFVAVMGPSGSGKSTLLHVLGGIDKPSSGEVVLAGKRLSTLSDKKLTITRRRQVGFIFQTFNLLPTLSAEENLTLPLLIDGQSPKEYRTRVDYLLELVRLKDRRHHKPDQLSGGEQQRVAIARALVTEPAIVLADEATGNLDSQAGEEVMHILRHACQERGQTIVMVTHDARASSHADRIVFLKDGRIAGETSLKSGGSAGTIMQRLEELEI